ncbi:MAG: hypothetical protein JWM59_2393 [Verrucomicrobiales bacterium]|nr:hypothetical protein [Verrucomicrobiales bacterium]
MVLWKTHAGLRIQTEAEFRELLAQDLKTGTECALKENFERVRDYTSKTWVVKFLWN